MYLKPHATPTHRLVAARKTDEVDAALTSPKKIETAYWKMTKL